MDNDRACDYCFATGHDLARCPVRKQEVLLRYVSGETYAAIGADLGLTRERVRQIVVRQAGPDLDAVELARSARAAARKAELDSLRVRVVDLLRREPGLSCPEVATQLEASQVDVRAALGEDAGRLLVRHSSHRDPVFTRADLLAGMRRAAEWCGTDVLSGGDYDRAVAALGGLASSVRILQVFGSWNAAREAAGLATRHTRRVYTRRWTPAEMLGFVARYLEAEPRGTFAGYVAWASANDAPSGQTVRNTLGGWGAVKTAAVPLVLAAQR